MRRQNIFTLQKHSSFQELLNLLHHFLYTMLQFFNEILPLFCLPRQLQIQRKKIPLIFIKSAISQRT
jgi:hypothetical protein